MAQREQRNAAAALHDELVRLRALLRSYLGPNDPDYRLLCVPRRGRSITDSPPEPTAPSGS